VLKNVGFKNRVRAALHIFKQFHTQAAPVSTKKSYTAFFRRLHLPGSKLVELFSSHLNSSSNGHQHAEGLNEAYIPPGHNNSHHFPAQQMPFAGPPHTLHLPG